MRRSGIVATCVLFPVAIATGSALAQAQAQGAGSAKPPTESGITLYGGYRASSSLTEATTGQSVNVNSGSSYALALDFGIDHQTQWELFYSRQKTELSSGGFSALVNNLPLTIEYFHVGGTYFPGGLGKGGYVVGGFGATLLSPDRAGLSSVTKPSINLGGGFLFPIGKNLGVRLEGRGYATLLNNSGGMFCGSNSGCVVSIKGDALYQWEALVGLSGRF